jgi:hypothetical protein
VDPNFAIDHERLAHVYTYLQKYDDAIEEETKARMTRRGRPQERAPEAK